MKSMRTEKTFLSAAVMAACIGFAGSAAAVPYEIGFEQQSVFLFDPTTPTPGGAAFGIHNPFSGRVTGVQSVWWPATDGTATRGTASESTPIVTTDPANPTAPAVIAGGANQGAVSALKVIGQTGILSVPDDGSLSLIQTLTTVFHRNNAIVGTSPNSGFIDSSTLFSLNGDDVEDPNTLPFQFDETTNSGNCQPEGNPNGTTCDDLFLFPLISFAPVPITLDGIAFQFLFDIAPGSGAITNLPQCRANISACTIVDGVPFVTVWTGEGSVNSLSTTVQARLAPPPGVPSPGTLSVLGLGLASLGAMLRRRRAAR